MVFGEIPLAGRSDKTEGGATTMLVSFTGARSIDFALIEGRKAKVAAIRTSDDSPLTMNACKFKHVGNKVTFHALAKHVELTFAESPPSLDRIGFFGEIPDSDAYTKQTFSAKEVAAARKAAKPAAVKKTKKSAAVKKVKAKVKVKAKTPDSDPKKVKVKYPKGTKRGSFGHIDPTKEKVTNLVMAPTAFTVNPPRVPPLRKDDVVEEERDSDNDKQEQKQEQSE